MVKNSICSKELTGESLRYRQFKVLDAVQRNPEKTIDSTAFHEPKEKWSKKRCVYGRGLPKRSCAFDIQPLSTTAFMEGESRGVRRKKYFALCISLLGPHDKIPDLGGLTTEFYFLIVLGA